VNSQEQSAIPPVLSENHFNETGPDQFDGNSYDSACFNVQDDGDWDSYSFNLLLSLA
jgi:hypothetical protein